MNESALFILTDMLYLSVRGGYEYRSERISLQEVRASLVSQATSSQIMPEMQVSVLGQSEDTIMPRKDPIARAAYNREYNWAGKHKIEVLEYHRRYRANHKSETEQYTANHKERAAGITAIRRMELKIKALSHYGLDGKCVCVKCGYSDVRALSLDHIEGGGSQQRKGVHTDFYKWIIRNNYPEGFQTLCMNCNWIKRHENREYFKGYKDGIKINKPIVQPPLPLGGQK